MHAGAGRSPRLIAQPRTCHPSAHLRHGVWRLPALVASAVWLAAIVLTPVDAVAGQAAPSEETIVDSSAGASAFAALPVGYSGPPPPEPPAVLTRDAEGRATVRAVRVHQPLRIDGALDEALYRDVPPMSGFIQVEPHAGEPATEPTEVWLAYDDRQVYLAVRAWDSQMDRLVATEMRRDTTTMFQGDDIVSFIFDTFYDRRNSIAFSVNPIGGRSDGQITNERQYSSDWNPVWELKTGRFEGGWTFEAAIPFKSLRYQPGRSQLWGFNIMRVKRSKNEISALTRVPPARGQQAAQQASYAATVVGLEVPPGGRSLDVKPYATSSLTSDLQATPRVWNDLGADIGLDAKYAITQNLTADFTYNTDFAQVEADEQQVNLSRFSLFFPEKREFFLENQGMFSFGGVAAGGFSAGNSVAPVLFYSRRIGLHQGRPVPLNVGGRLTGRAGAFSIGALNIRTGDEPHTGAQPTNFSVLRVKRDVLRRSSVGVLLTNRSVGGLGGRHSLTYGADGTFLFLQNLVINSYWARTESDRRTVLGERGNDTSYRAQLDYTGDRYGLQLERLAIGDTFNPEVGFVRRTDMVRNLAQARFSPRPRRPGVIRKYTSQASIEYVENGAGRLESRERAAEVGLEFQNADRVSLSYENAFEYLPRPFEIARAVVLPVGGYRFDAWRLRYNMGQQRRISANLSLEHGSFYSGRKTTVNVGRGRMNITPQLSVEPTYSINRVSLVEGEFTTHLAGSRVTYTMTPLMFVSALLQYNSATNSVSTNARLRWEYRPGSELFVVYNEERNTLARSFPSLANRALIVKVNRLFRL